MKLSPLLFVLAGLASCAASTPRDPESPPTEVRAPMELEGSTDSVWTYLAATHDADGDGRVTPAEYDRGEIGFARLDADGDGVVTAADFAVGPTGDMAAMIAQMRGQMAMAQYLQLDDDPAVLSVEELEAAFHAFDTDGDFAVDRAELEARRDASRGELSPGMARLADMGLSGEPWSALADEIDGDRDGLLTLEELMAYFEAHDEGTGAWDLEAIARAAAGEDPLPERTASTSGPPEGELAPDFTLAPLHGGPPVTLSSFRGDVPVALVFGSYT